MWEAPEMAPGFIYTVESKTCSSVTLIKNSLSVFCWMWMSELMYHMNSNKLII